jgi:hypothetical protein
MPVACASAAFLTVKRKAASTLPGAQRAPTALLDLVETGLEGQVRRRQSS